jgi:membrane-associated phospholipid phosphatase
VYTPPVLTELRSLFLDAGALLAKWYGRFCIAVLGLVTLALITVTYDSVWLKLLRIPKNKPIKHVAKWFSFWGDYHTGTMIVVVVVLIVGLLRHSSLMKRAALACFISASTAGLVANAIRSTVGRPRPSAKLPDGAYGPTIEYKFLGFPSAHAATSFGTATSLAVAMPAVGVPTLIFASGVVWSRMQLNRHHPTDVLIGGALGALVGVTFGLAARRRRDESPDAVLSRTQPSSG